MSSDNFRTLAEKLTERVKSLLSTADYARQISSNVNNLHLHPPEAYRLLENNTRIGIINPRLSFDSQPIGLGARVGIFDAFANAGDPLASAILETFGEDAKYRDLFSVLGHSEVADKLLKRTITEMEYDGYLTGKMPFAIVQEKAYFVKQ